MTIQVLPELVRPAEDFSQHIIISYAGGYDYEVGSQLHVGTSCTVLESLLPPLLQQSC